MQTVAVIFGGKSAEHDVSIVTALATIIKPLELTRRYRVETIYVAKNGAWYWDDKLKDIKLFSSGEIKNFINRTSPASVQFDGGMTLIKSSGIAGRKQNRKIDIVFPSMHGTYGEDGALMGLLDMATVPYVGCGVSASAIAMNKVLAKQLAVACNIPVSKFLAFTKVQIERELRNSIKDIVKHLSFPIFVKPAKLGSSIGITRIVSEKELGNALEVASHYDDEIIVEEAVNNLIELTLPIMGNDQPQPALLEKPLTKPEDFFDFDTKYMQGGKKGKGNGKSAAEGAQGYSQIPADISTPLYAKAEALGLSVYRALGCSGIARVDMLVDQKTSAVYFNEVNPLPGGLYAHNWNKAGISNVELVQKLIDYAVERHASRESLTTSFNTNYLQQF
jgi:D-alanine-D-alanine ligase